MGTRDFASINFSNFTFKSVDVWGHKVMGSVVGYGNGVWGGCGTPTQYGVWGHSPENFSEIWLLDE